MKGKLVESMSMKLGDQIKVRRYNIADMISESYRVIYQCKEDSNLRKLAESHLEDLKENPKDIDRLSRQLATIKEMQRMVESHELKDEDLVERKSRVDESSQPRFRRRKPVNEADDPELTEEELDELTKHLAEIRKNKKPIDNSKDESIQEAEEPEAPESRIFQLSMDIYAPADYDFEELVRELEDDLSMENIEIVGHDITASWSREEYGYKVGGKGIHESVEDFDTNEGKSKLVDEQHQDSVEGKEERVIVHPKYCCNESFQQFIQKSKDKAFYKTFKKMHESLKEGRALTRQESIGLYKAANSALTQMSIELEHNPEFLQTFNESSALLSSDVNKLRESLARGKAPSQKTMKSLSKFSEVLLNESVSWREGSQRMIDELGIDGNELYYPSSMDIEDDYTPFITYYNDQYIANEPPAGVTSKSFDSLEDAKSYLESKYLSGSKKVNEAEDTDAETSEDDFIGDDEDIGCQDLPPQVAAKCTAEKAHAKALANMEKRKAKKSTMNESDEEDEDDFVGDDEGNVQSEEADAFDQEYADARVELHKDLEDEYSEDEDPGVQEKLAQDAEEVINLPGISDEQVAEIAGEGSEEGEKPTEETSERDEEEPEDDESEITDDELEELKKYLKEMRSVKKIEESQTQDLLSQVKQALDDAGIRYSSKGRNGDRLIVSKKDLQRASEIRNSIDPNYTVTVATPA